MVTALQKLPKRKSPTFTVEQDKFILAYDGDLVATCNAAGVRVSNGYQWLKSNKIRTAILARGVKDPALVRFIATRAERQEYWTEIMFKKSEETTTRLKASELLGRSECDFVDRRIVTGPDGGPVQSVNLNVNAGTTMDDLEERLALLRGGEKKVGVDKRLEFAD